jgi:transposase-like protein
MRTRRSRYHGHRFPAEIISHAVWLYHRFCLSFRDVEDLLAERGIIVSYETIRFWCRKFGSEYARKLKRRQGRLGDIWHLDEVFVRINGEQRYLWRAVDQDGDVIDILVQLRRDQRAAERSSAGYCGVKGENHFASLPTNSRAIRQPCERCCATSITIQNAMRTIVPNSRINRLDNESGTCVVSNRLARPSGFSPYTVLFRISFESEGTCSDRRTTDSYDLDLLRHGRKQRRRKPTDRCDKNAFTGLT